MSCLVELLAVDEKRRKERRLGRREMVSRD